MNGCAIIGLFGFEIGHYVAEASGGEEIACPAISPPFPLVVNEYWFADGQAKRVRDGDGWMM
jgi:hypothetical protein